MSGHSKWNNIQHRKGAQDKKRASLFTKLGKELTIAAKEGGGDPNFNPRLRLAIDKAKAGNMPKDILERAIKKGTGELEGVDYIEMRYEGYGPAGTAFSRKGGNLGADGAVSWMFNKKGEIIISAENVADSEEFMMVALEAGAEDIIEEDGEFQVLTDPADFQTVLQALTDAGYKYEEAEITMLPENKVAITDLDTAKKVMVLYDALDDLDDVQEVFANFDIPDEIMEQLN